MPATLFCEWEDTKSQTTPTWFALAEDRPSLCFVGIWTRWPCVRVTKAYPLTSVHRLFGFMATELNGEVRSIHPTLPAACVAEAVSSHWHYGLAMNISPKTGVCPVRASECHSQLGSGAVFTTVQVEKIALGRIFGRPWH